MNCSMVFVSSDGSTFRLYFQHFLHLSGSCPPFFMKHCITPSLFLPLSVHLSLFSSFCGTPASLLNQHTPKRCLRSSSGLLIDVPRINLGRFGRRAFACAGPTLWNNLPTNLRVNGNHTQFKKLLKTYLFST